MSKYNISFNIEYPDEGIPKRDIRENIKWHLETILRGLNDYEVGTISLVKSLRNVKLKVSSSSEA